MRCPICNQPGTLINKVRKITTAAGVGAGGISLYQAHLPVRLLVQLSARDLELCSAVFLVA